MFMGSLSSNALDSTAKPSTHINHNDVNPLLLNGHAVAIPLINSMKRSQQVVRQHDNNSTIHTIYNYSDTTGS